MESSSLDSLTARTSTGLSARQILRSSRCFIRLFTFKDAILKPRFADSELDKRGFRSRCYAYIQVKTSIVLSICGGFTDTGDLAFKEPGDQLFLITFSKFLYNESSPSRFRCNPPLLSPLWVILA